MMAVGGEGDRFARLLELARDLLEELAYEYQRARSDAMSDPLTGLPNRRLFQPRLEQELSRARRYGHRLTLIMVDIDHFKEFNDVHGHRAGDDLLRRLGRLMQQELREPDIVFRVGGEEFVILLPETDIAGAGHVIRRLQERVRRDDQLKVTLSFGVAEFPTHAEDAEPLIDAADRALYAAKNAGRNTVRLPDGAVPPPAPAAPAPPAPHRYRPPALGAPGEGAAAETVGEGAAAETVGEGAVPEAPGARREPVEVGFHVDDERPASIWLNGRLLRIREAAAAEPGDGEAGSVFHVSTDEGDYRLVRVRGRWYLEGRL